MERVATEKGSFFIYYSLISWITIHFIRQKGSKEVILYQYILFCYGWCYTNVLYIFLSDRSENKSPCTVCDQYGSGHFGGARGNE